MKKELLGTTALVAAGLLVGAGVGQKANAAEPLQATIDGFANTSLTIWDDDDFADDLGASTREHAIEWDGEIRWRAKTTLDNGIEVGARIEIEAFNSGGGTAIIDETYMWFEGTFGQIVIGHDDHAAYPMHYQAPVIDWYQSINTASFGYVAPTVGSIPFTPTTYILAGGDGAKVVYYTPRFQGFQLGASWQPDDSTVQAGPAFTAPADTTDGAAELWSVSANYVQTLGEVDVAASIGYLQGDIETGETSTTLDPEDLSLGLNVGMRGFTVGASYLIEFDQQGSGLDRTQLDVGLTYATGPWAVGVEYFRIDAEEPDGSDDDFNAFGLGAAYNLGPGVDLHAAFKYAEYDVDVGDLVAGALTLTDSEPSGWVFVFGPSLSW